jgi:phospho-N-acetylmuramoyl-pentapeptide-transferase
MLAWHESKVVVRFWIIGILCAFFALTTIKLR